MRIIEPKSKPNNQLRRRKLIKKRLVSAAAFLTIAGISFLIYGYFGTQNSGKHQNSGASIDLSIDINSNSAPPQLLSGDQFQQFYESLVFPNTQMLDSPPEITGNKAADGRIIQIAESRGYVLRSVPILPIVKTNEPNLGEDDLLQPKANEAWKQLKSAAREDGLDLILTSAYRSVERQRALFLSRLGAAANQPQRLISGELDDEIVGVLQFASPPGYSRHHTGYTIDIRCGGDNRAFELTVCFNWLRENNYENAKQYGWLPSYPEGVDKQGPEPEAWEYVWVGRSTLGL